MPAYNVSPPKPALLVFVDIIDSSVYSSILGITKFAEKVLSFQELFEQLGKCYFNDKPYFADKIDSLCRVESRGDEGTVFVVDPRQSGAELVHRAVKFAFELKARLKILNLRETDLPPTEMRIAVGIHFGEVALVTTLHKRKGIYRNLIDGIVGYSINYAKRVESSSRTGSLSQVFLSKVATDLLSRSPIAFYRHEVPLRGIQANQEVYEVRSAFLDGIPLSRSDGAGAVSNEEFITYFANGFTESQFIDEPWLKSFVLSVLDSRRDACQGTASAKAYSDRISRLAWHKPTEDDPIMVYWRARECEQDGKYSRAVTCLKSIIRDDPHFLHARIKLVDVCYRLLEVADKAPQEVVFVRDTAEELLEKYQDMLLENERKRLEGILRKTKGAGQ
jgi:class 3 adenylate cyclase